MCCIACYAKAVKAAPRLAVVCQSNRLCVLLASVSAIFLVGSFFPHVHTLGREHWRPDRLLCVCAVRRVVMLSGCLENMFGTNRNLLRLLTF